MAFLQLGSMSKSVFSRWLPLVTLSALLTFGLATVGSAQTANFDGLTLSAGFTSTQATVTGATAGFFSLSSITARDRNGNLCLGYADSTPDHIMVLQQDFAHLTLQVDSGSNETTLLVQGPDDNTIRCGSGASRRNPGALLEDTDWQAGTYRIWVAAFDQGQRYDYNLTASE